MSILAYQYSSIVPETNTQPRHIWYQTLLSVQVLDPNFVSCKSYCYINLFNLKSRYNRSLCVRHKGNCFVYSKVVFYNDFLYKVFGEGKTFWKTVDFMHEVSTDIIKKRREQLVRPMNELWYRPCTCKAILG